MTTSSPTSLQLRLALSGSSSFASPPLLPRFTLLVRTRPGISRRPLPCLRISASEGERARAGLGWSTAPDNGPGSVSGWSDSSSAQGQGEPGKSESYKSLGGMVGAGVAGIVVVAGITFAALSVGKGGSGSSKHKQEMEPLTKQQEILLASDSQNIEAKEYDNKGLHIVGDNVHPEGEKGKDKNSAFFSGDKEVVTENKAEENIDTQLETAPNGYHASSSYVLDGTRSSSKQDLLDESTFSDLSYSPETGLGSNTFPEPERLDPFDTSDISNSHLSLDQVAVQSTSGPVEEPVNDSFTSVNSTETHSKNGETGFPANGSFTDNFSGPLDRKVSVNSQFDAALEPKVDGLSTETEKLVAPSSQISVEKFSSSPEEYVPLASASPPAFENALDRSGDSGITGNQLLSESPSSLNTFFYSGIPAPSAVSEALLVTPGKVLVPPTVDQVQGQALAALQALKVVEADVKAGDICTRREYARWLVSASSALSRNSISKVYPAMYIENVSELAFDDIIPQDPDFIYIQGLAEAGLISSKLSRQDLQCSGHETGTPYYFHPESPLSRQDLVSWKLALEKKQLPEANRETLRQLSGFIDTEKIDPDACPSIVADLSAGEQGIIALAFGYTKLFQPDKPVTKAQAAIAIATCEASDVVGEELARIEAEAVAENAVAAHSALVAQVEKDLNASFEKVLSAEREKIDAVEKMADEAKRELERLRTRREEDNVALMKERAAVESEMEVLSKLRREVEEQLESLMTNKVVISYEKERINKLKDEAEKENQEIVRLQYELEVERKALSLARAWAEDEAKRAREHAKALEEARDRWERQGIKVVVDSDLQEETSAAGVTWVNAGQQLSVNGAIDRAESLMDKLKNLAGLVTGKSRELIDNIIQVIYSFILNLRRWSLDTKKGAEECSRAAVVALSRSGEELQQSLVNLTVNLKDGAKRLMGDCKEGVEKFSQRFKM